MPVHSEANMSNHQALVQRLCNDFAAQIAVLTAIKHDLSIALEASQQEVAKLQKELALSIDRAKSA